MSKQIFNPLSGTFDTVLTDASELAYDNATSGLTADDVQEAIDEVESRVDATETVANAAIPSSEKGAALGVATLDAGGKVPASQLPNSIMDYLGTWAASTNTPTLANGTGNAGDVYVASDAGTVDFGAGNITFAAGDWVIYSGSIWEKSINSNNIASVNGYTGVVVLDTDDIAEGATNLYYTDERAQDAVGNNLLDTASVNLSYNDGTGQISADVLPAGVDHDSLQNFVANEHVDHSTVSITAGTGLTGGGNITASRTLDIANTGVVAASYGSATQVSTITVNSQGQLTAASNTSIAIPSSQITDFNEAAQDAVGTILTDSSSVDFTYNDGLNTITADVLPAGVNHDALQNFVANEHVDHSTININTNANSGLSGGGDLTTSRSLLVDPTNATSVTAAPTDVILIADASDSNNLKKTTAQDIANLGGSASLIEFANDKSSNQSISNNTITKVTWQTPSIDTESAWDSGNDRWTAVNDCRIVVSAQIEFAPGSTGYRTINVAINNTLTYLYQINAQTGTLVTHCQITTPPIELAATDYVEIFCYQNNGGSLNVNSGVSTFWGITGRRI